MSVIFPTSPSEVTIHPLPKGAEFITYRANDTLTISAWMPDNHFQISQENITSNDDFFYRHCDDCERNCCSFLDHYTDEDGEIDWEHSDLEGHCNVYDDGYHGQYCPLGYTKEDEIIEFSSSPMVFEISLSHIGDNKRFVNLSDGAYLCAGEISDGQFHSTPLLMASNVFGTEDNPENICWGYNEKPHTLRGIAVEYFNTPFNNDLTTLDTFEDNCRRVRNHREFGDVFPNHDDVLLSTDADALLLLDAGEDVTAFFHMIAAGFESLSNAPHIMMIPVKNSSFEKDGNTYSGYLTSEDNVGKKWFITMDGLLIGQV